MSEVSTNSSEFTNILVSWYGSYKLKFVCCVLQKRGRMDDEKIETMLTDLATIKKFE
jgi:hypothetical protein